MSAGGSKDSAAHAAAESKESGPEAGDERIKSKVKGSSVESTSQQPPQNGATTKEDGQSQTHESDVSPQASNQAGSGTGREEDIKEGEQEEEEGSTAPKGDDTEDGLPKPATGQEEDEGPEATGKHCSLQQLCSCNSCAVLCCVLQVCRDNMSRSLGQFVVAMTLRAAMLAEAKHHHAYCAGRHAV